jgi:replicative DNA helicase
LRTGIPGERIKRGELSESEFERLKEEDEILHSAKLFIQDNNCTSISQIISKARKLKEEEDISLFIVDYLQLLSVTGNAESRQYEVAEISRKLKLLAMEVKAPFICISQLSRKVEERRDHRPMMSDLRDSGQIEQDSDVVMFIQRREYYDPDDAPGMAEIVVAKNRNGSSVPSCFLHFDGKCGKFSNPIREVILHKQKPVRHYRAERFLHEGSHPLLR